MGVGRFGACDRKKQGMLIGEWYWYRMTEEQRETLRERYDRKDFSGMLAVLNEAYVGPKRLEMCCDLEEAYERVGKKLEEWNRK